MFSHPPPCLLHGHAISDGDGWSCSYLLQREQHQRRHRHRYAPREAVHNGRSIQAFKQVSEEVPTIVHAHTVLAHHIGGTEH